MKAAKLLGLLLLAVSAGLATCFIVASKTKPFTKEDFVPARFYPQLYSLDELETLFESILHRGMSERELDELIYANKHNGLRKSEFDKKWRSLGICYWVIYSEPRRPWLFLAQIKSGYAYQFFFNDAGVLIDYRVGERSLAYANDYSIENLMKENNCRKN